MRIHTHEQITHMPYKEMIIWILKYDFQAGKKDAYTNLSIFQNKIWF